jgi:hypothetical protein
MPFFTAAVSRRRRRTGIRSRACLRKTDAACAGAASKGGCGDHFPWRKWSAAARICSALFFEGARLFLVLIVIEERRPDRDSGRSTTLAWRAGSRRRGHVGVPERRLHFGERGGAVDSVRPMRVPEPVRADRRLDPCRSGYALYGAEDSASGKATAALIQARHPRCSRIEPRSL